MRKIPKKNLIGIVVAVALIILIAVFISVARDSTGAENYEEVNFPQKETELSAVPDEYKSNVYLSFRGVGACDKLLNKVHVTVIFVEDSKSVWSESDKAEFKESCENTFLRIQSDAKVYNKDLKITSDYRSTKINVPFIYAEHENWADSVFASLDMSAYADANLSLEREFGTEEAAIIFALNYEGRSFTANSENTEYTIIFDDAPAIYHEICHLFGACDFYFPKEVEEIAEKYLNGSIMYDCYGGKVDDFTAYIIGWKDELTENAESFLKDTMHVTEEQLNEAKVTS